MLAGRFWGKTKAGAEETVHRSLSLPGQYGAVIAKDFHAARTECIEGSSGVLACTPPGYIGSWNRSTGELWFSNGTKLQCYSAEEPQRLRGPSFHFAWCDELAAWRYLSRRKDNPWDMLMMAVRLGTAQIIVCTTPKPQPKLREIMAAPTTVVIKGRSIDNIDNVAENMLRDVIRQYEGTAIGRQELDAEMLDEAPGALWKRTMLDGLHVSQAPALKRIVVAIDPSVTAHDGSDEAGIVAAGIGPALPGMKHQEQMHGYVLEDGSGRMPPAAWANRAVRMYNDHQADRIIAETNQGGDMVESTLRVVSDGVAYRGIHAKKGKKLRAEPIQALYERGLIHHVSADLGVLETQMCTWEPDTDDSSPDRVDALVYALTDLMIGKHDVPLVLPGGGKRTSVWKNA